MVPEKITPSQPGPASLSSWTSLSRGVGRQGVGRHAWRVKVKAGTMPRNGRAYAGVCPFTRRGSPPILLAPLPQSPHAPSLNSWTLPRPDVPQAAALTLPLHRNPVIPIEILLRKCDVYVTISQQSCHIFIW